MNSTNNTCEYPEISLSIYSTTYLIIGVIILIIGLSYFIYVLRDLTDLTPKLPGYVCSQATFIVVASIRGLGYIIYAGICFYDKSLASGSASDIAQPFTIGLPGYFMTISFYLLFFLWYRICVNLLFNDSRGKFDDIRYFIAAAFVAVCAFGLVFLIISVCANNHINLQKASHVVEVVLATVRDFGSALLFLIYTFKNIWFKMTKPRLTFAKNESIYCMMIFSLAGALLIRFGSLVIYAVKYLNAADICIPQSIGNYLNTLITSIISEIAPCVIVFITKKRSGLLSVYDYLP